MSPFEIIMLACFGAAWPASIYKSYTSRKNTGKSLTFLIIVFIGYVSGVIHKMFYNYDAVIFLYILNSIMVFTDMVLYFRNRRLMKSGL
ncbi:MAG: hypothetical protein HPY74_12990 [Firmicutes bacterium]|nr:hypothetical protein [Bacillota bacterium]